MKIKLTIVVVILGVIVFWYFLACPLIKCVTDEKPADYANKYHFDSLYVQLQNQPLEGSLYENLPRIKDEEIINHDNSTANAIIEFYKHGGRAVDYMMERLLTEESISAKSYAIHIIGVLGCTDCAGALLPYMSDPDWRVRHFTVDSLGLLGYKDFSMLARNAIQKDQSERVKIKAILALGEFGSNDDALYLESLASGNFKNDERIKKAIKLAMRKRIEGAH